MMTIDKRLAGVLGACLALGVPGLPHAAAAQDKPAVQVVRPGAVRPCEADPKYHELDFWVGRWDAMVGGKKEGTNVLEKTLHGCVLVESWIGVEGDEVKSFFLYNPVTGQRKQVWASDDGRMKERLEIAAPEKGTVRLLGEVVRKDGSKVLDRSTLTPLSADRVHQLLELSRDDGKTWEVSWDVVYVRQKGI